MTYDFPGLYRLNYKDIRKASATLAEAFCDYPLFSPISKSVRQQALSIMFEVDLRYALRRGAAYALGPELSEVATWQFDYRQREDLWGYLLSVRLRTLRLFSLAGPKAMRAMEDIFSEIERHVGALILPENTVYLSSIGVKPSFRGQGAATRLLAPVLKAMEEAGQSVFLQTNAERNVGIYQRFGFEVMERLEAGIVPCPTWFMLRRGGG